MVANLVEIERCAVCGKDVAEGRRYCRFYEATGARSFCSPACAESFLRGPGHPVNGEGNRDLVEEWVEERRWHGFPVWRAK